MENQLESLDNLYVYEINIYPTVINTVWVDDSTDISLQSEALVQGGMTVRERERGRDDNYDSGLYRHCALILPQPYYFPFVRPHFAVWVDRKLTFRCRARPWFKVE